MRRTAGLVCRSITRRRCGSLDLYYWGWHREGSIACLAVLAMVFLAWGNRLGVLLLGALIAFSVDALESANCWDYLVDPLYWLVSLGVVARKAIGGLRDRRRRRTAGQFG